MNSPKNIAIIGAGPCGLMAAEMLAKAGARVTIYDRMPSPARKFLIAGRGGLNLTHSEPLETFLTRYGAAASWLAPSINAFTPRDLRAWCESLGEETFVGSSGRVFPKHMKAVELLRAWLLRLGELGVQYAPRHSWQGWEDEKLKFLDAEHKTILIKADATLLALGGASWPRLGSDGSWVEILSNAGVNIAPLIPSNCGFVVPWSAHFAERFAGQPLKPVSITHDNISRQGEAMITKNGIEGGVIYALSSSIRDAISAHGNAQITLDVRPDMTPEALVRKLESQKRASKSLSTYLKGLGFSALVVSLLRETTPPEQLSHATTQNLAACLKALPVTLTATTGIARAISSAGGIRQDAVDADFMLKAKPGIFAAGEMLDWEAPTGGYLLQACFSTAAAAANGMLRYIKND